LRVRHKEFVHGEHRFFAHVRLGMRHQIHLGRRDATMFRQNSNPRVAGASKS
jgi:hypothetical protein